MVAFLGKSYCWAGRKNQQHPGSLPAAVSRLLADRWSSCFCPLAALNPFLFFRQTNASDFESHSILCPCLPLRKSYSISFYYSSPSNSSTPPAACDLPRSHYLSLPSSGVSFGPTAPFFFRSSSESHPVRASAAHLEWLNCLPPLRSGPVSASPVTGLERLTPALNMVLWTLGTNFQMCLVDWNILTWCILRSVLMTFAQSCFAEYSPSTQFYYWVLCLKLGTGKELSGILGLMYVFSVRDGSIRVSDVSLRICLQYFINFASSWKPWEQMRLGSEQFSVVWYGLMWKWHLSLVSHDSASVVVPIRMNLPVRVCRSAVPWDRPMDHQPLEQWCHYARQRGTVVHSGTEVVQHAWMAAMYSTLVLLKWGPI